MKVNPIATLPVKEALKISLLTNTNRTMKVQGRRFSVENLKTFAVHGCRCARCGREGNTIIAYHDKGGILHIDLFHKDGEKLILMNRDHIIPKSKKGPNTLWNYQTMCIRCNTKKANNETPEDVKLSHFRMKWKNIYVAAQNIFNRRMPAFIRKNPTWNVKMNALRDLYLHRLTWVVAKVVA